MKSLMFPLAIIFGALVGTCTQSCCDSPDTRVTADISVGDPSSIIEVQRRRIFRKSQQEDNAPRTTPYVDESAPDLIDDSVGGEAPIFEFAVPEKAEVVVDPPDDLPQPTNPVEDTVTDQVTGVFQSISKLFNGEGSITDIVSIITVVMALFGGSSMGGSDTFFKLILGLFSGKANFNAILQERVSNDKKPRRRRRK